MTIQKLTQKLFQETVWNIAYRLLNNDHAILLLDEQLPRYTPLPSSNCNWIADPFLIEHDNIIYLFMERFDYRLGRGVIAYAKWQHDRWSNIKDVLHSDCHLSYPHVFHVNADIYMIPETFERKSVELYKAVDFPEKWEYVQTIVDGIDAADTTLLEADGITWLFTAKVIEYGESFQLLIYYSTDGITWHEHHNNPVTCSEGSRSAGRIFLHQGKWIRPSQEGVLDNYGCAITFNAITALTDSQYGETTLRTISPKDFMINNCNDVHGIHTYGIVGDMEVIDYKFTRFNILKPLWRFLKLIRTILNK